MPATIERTTTPGHDAPDVLDQTMTRSDLVFVLGHLRFVGRDRLATLRLDREARNYLIDALRRNGPV